MNHVYEVVFESPQMWLKIQASRESKEQATDFLEYHFGGNAPDPLQPLYRNVTFSFHVPRKLSECADRIFNWETIKDRLPTGWDDQEFRVVEGPYQWCETLSDDCDCYGSKGRLDVAYCSDFGLHCETTKRASKSPNTVREENLLEMRRALVRGQKASRANRDVSIGVPLEPSEQEGLYCQVDGRYHAYSEQV